MLFTKVAFAIAAFIGFVAADCAIKHVDTCTYGDGNTAKIGDIVKGEHVCLSQGAGDYTFYMSLWNWGQHFCIFDNACKVVAAAEKPDCVLPYVWMDNHLKYVLTLTDVKSDGLYSTAYFSFNYANGKYSINNNHCQCVDGDCKCAFPVNGEPE